MRWRALLAAVLSSTLSLAAGCHRPTERARPSSQTARFDALFGRHCSGCHGADGRFGPAVPLNDPLFLALVSDESLRRVIAGGRGLMPAFGADHQGPLTDAEIDSMISTLRAKWERDVSYAWLDGARAALAPREGSTDGSPQVGQRLFRAACADCHAEGGAAVRDEAGSLADPNYLALVSDALIRRMVITGRPDLKMPPYEKSDAVAESYGEQVDDLVTYVSAWRRSSWGKQSTHRETRSQSGTVAER